MDPDTRSRISVIIPTYNRPGPLQACLEALSRGFPVNAEVIVVSDGGDRSCFPELSRFENTLNLTVIHAEHGGPAAARNHGLANAGGEICAFIDDDCLPEPGWLDAIASAMQHDRGLAVAGRTINGLPGNNCAAAMQLVLDLAERDRRNRDYDPFFYPSNNIAFPTEPLRAIGGFDSAYRSSEDRELCRRWLRSGYRLAPEDNAVLAHLPEVDLGGLWRRFVHYGEGAARFHDDPEGSWGQTFAYHFRIPSLMVQEFRDGNYRNPVRLCLLMVFWEFANLAGFVRGRFRREAGE